MIDPTEAITRRKLLVLGAGAALVPLMSLTGCEGGEEAAESPYAERPETVPMEEGSEQPMAGAPRTEPTQPPAGAERQTTEAAQPRQTAQAGGAEAAPPAGDVQLVTEVPAMEPLVQSLNYTNESEKPDQRCNNCLLFTQAGENVGKCQLFAQGYVAEGGWCMSWAPKAPA